MLKPTKRSVNMTIKIILNEFKRESKGKRLKLIIKKVRIS